MVIVKLPLPLTLLFLTCEVTIKFETPKLRADIFALGSCEYNDALSVFKTVGTPNANGVDIVVPGSVPSHILDTEESNADRVMDNPSAETELTTLKVSTFEPCF